MSTLGLSRNPVRQALSRSTWAAAWYLFAYLFTGTVLFAVALTAALTGAALAITLAGIPVLVAAAGVVRWCADVERARLRPRYGVVDSGYREPPGPGVVAKLRTRWQDPATWRDIAYLLGMYVPLVTLDVLALTLWLTFLAGITLPAWYWAPWQSVHGTRFHGYQLGYFPNGPHGHPGYGLYIDTLPKALLAAAISLILFLLCNYALVATARAHTAAARALLGRQEDPLREAKEVLRRPGPLNTLIPNER